MSARVSGALPRGQASRAGGPGLSVVGRGSANGQIAEIQRARLLASAAAVIDEHGYANTSTSDIVARSRVSRRTFYELFASRDDCLLELSREVVTTLEGELRAACVDGLGWRERIRMGLWTLLCYLDHESALARVLLVESTRGGTGVLELRSQVLASLAAVVDEGRQESASAADCSALTAEGVVGAALAILTARLQRREREPLSGLLGELTALVVLPYLGAAAARRERTRPAPASPSASQSPSKRVGGRVLDPLSGVPMRLTYRTTRVLDCVAEQPGASNRQVADHAGITDQGQVSKLLARLERLGLLQNSGNGHLKGEPNQWQLTVLGEQVTQSILTHTRKQPDQQTTNYPC